MAVSPSPAKMVRQPRRGDHARLAAGGRDPINRSFAHRVFDFMPVPVASIDRRGRAVIDVRTGLEGRRAAVERGNKHQDDAWSTITPTGARVEQHEQTWAGFKAMMFYGTIGCALVGAFVVFLIAQ